MLSSQQLQTYQDNGHLTVPNLISRELLEEVRQDLDIWKKEYFHTLSQNQREWYLEKGGQLRKLDNPVLHRTTFRKLAFTPPLLAVVKLILGPDLVVFFSQVFMKPPEGGAPKPIHQDNYYFDPADQDAAITAWIALDDATVENGCLAYAQGRHQLLTHTAPKDQPFNLQITEVAAASLTLTPAPVSAGGVNLHHGNTPHQSGPNQSAHPRRAVAIHYVRDQVPLKNPPLKFDAAWRVHVP